MSFKVFPEVEVTSHPNPGYIKSLRYIVKTVTCGDESKRIFFAGNAGSHEHLAGHLWNYIRKFEQEHGISVECKGDSADGGGSMAFDLRDPNYPKIWVGGKSITYGPDENRVDTIGMLQRKYPTYRVSEGP